MTEIPKLEIYKIIILPSNKEKKIKSLEEKLGKCILVSFGNFAYVGELNKNQENGFYIKYQTAQRIEEKIIRLDSTNAIYIKMAV